MRILAIETACGPGTVAFIENERIFRLSCHDDPRTQVQSLFSCIEDVVPTDKGQRPEFVVTTHGPGSFTGLRIGLAAARGIALASGCPLATISGFEAYAACIGEARPSLVAIDANRPRDVLVQSFDSDGRAMADPENLELEQLKDYKYMSKNMIVTGNCLPKLRAYLTENTLFAPEKETYMTSLAKKALAQTNHASNTVTKPLYVRMADTS